MTRADRRFLWAGSAILLLAFALRLYSLREIPPGLTQDEVLNADIVEGILQGRHALFFREGFGHEPLYHYWSAPFQAMLGDNVLSIRLPAVVLGVLLVALTLRWARREFGSVAALVAGTGLAVSWWAIVFSRIGLRPIMLPVFLLLMALQWGRRPWLAGVWLGLALYTYTPAVTMLALPVLLAAYTMIARRVRGAPRSPAHDLLILGVALLIYLPLALTLRADPSLLERGEQLSGPVTALLGGDWRPLWHTTWATLGVFSVTGDPRWTYMLPDQPLFGPLTATVAYAGVLVALVRAWPRRPASTRYALTLGWLLCGLLPSMVTPDAPSTIRMVASLPVVYLLPGLAVDAAWRFGRNRNAPRPTRQPAAWLAAAGVAAFAGLLLWATVRDGFQRWPVAFETRDKYQSVYAEIAAAIDDQPGVTPVINTGFFYPIDADSVRRNLGRDPQARWTQGGNAVIMPSGEASWYIPEAFPVDAALGAVVDLAPPVLSSAQKPGFAVYALPADVTLTTLPEPIAFGNGALTLHGYRPLHPAADGSLGLLTQWRVTGPLPTDLKLFVHGLSADGTIITQFDGLDAVPHTLQPGDQFIQVHTLPGPSGESPLATVAIGAYRADDGVRLPSTGPFPDQARLPADRLLPLLP